LATQTWLLDDPAAQKFSILLMPETKDNAFIPKPKKSTPFSSWRSSSKQAADSAARAAKGRTRRMTPDEGMASYTTDPPDSASSTSSAADPDASAGRKRATEPAF
jgi:hypothetical protein